MSSYSPASLLAHRLQWANARCGGAPFVLHGTPRILLIASRCLRHVRFASKSGRWADIAGLLKRANTGLMLICAKLPATILNDETALGRRALRRIAPDHAAGANQTQPRFTIARSPR